MSLVPGPVRALFGPLLVACLACSSSDSPDVDAADAKADGGASEVSPAPPGGDRGEAADTALADTAVDPHIPIDAAADQIQVDAGGVSADTSAVPVVDAAADTAAVVPDAGPGVPDVGVDAPGPVADMGSAALPAGFMRALLLAQNNHAGTMVQFSGVAAAAITEADGRFALPTMADGSYKVLLRNGEYEEQIPQLTVRGGRTFVKNRYGTEQAFATVELPRAHRIHDGSRDTFQYNISPSGARLLLVQSMTGTMSRMSLLTGDARAATVIATGALGIASFLDEDRLFLPRAPNGWFSPWSYTSMPATGGMETPVLAAVVNHEYPRFVQGGTKILYRTPGATMAALTLVKADGSDPVVLGNGPFDWALVSADGNWAAFRTRDAPADQLRLANLRDGATRVVASGLSPFVDYAFTPNSQRLVYQAGSIFSVAVEGGAPVMLGKGDDHILSPEGSLVLFQDHYTVPLRVVPVEGGTPRNITVDTPTASLGLHKFSSDGRYVFFETVNALKAAATAALDVQILTTDHNARVIGYSPVGHAAFFTGSGRLYRMPLDRSGAREVLSEAAGDTWTSPRGRYLFFSRMEGAVPSLGLIDLQTGQSRSFRPGGGRPVFSADETRLVFGGGGKVWVGNTADGTQVAVADARFFYLEADGFSPDNSRVIFRADQIFTAAATDGSVTTPIARWVTAGTGFVRWMGNRQLVFPAEAYVDAPPFVEGLYVAPVP